MKLLLTFITSFLIFASQGSAQSFPFQELTIGEFLKYEQSLGTTIKEQNNEMITILVAEDLYPYVNSYNLAQPYQGERPMDIDSMVTSMEAFYDRNSKKVKFISYTLTPKAKTPQEIAMELQSEEGYSADEFVKRLNEQQSNPSYQQKIVEKYENLQKLFSEKGKLVENRKRSKGINLIKIKTYKINQAIVELSITHNEGLNKATNVDIFWE